MQLQIGESRPGCGYNLLYRCIDKDTDSVDKRGKLLYDLCRVIRTDITRAFGIKNKSQRIDTLADGS